MQKNPAVNINTEQPLVQVNTDINKEMLVVNENNTITKKKKIIIIIKNRNCAKKNVVKVFRDIVKL